MTRLPSVPSSLRRRTTAAASALFVVGLDSVVLLLRALLRVLWRPLRTGVTGAPGMGGGRKRVLFVRPDALGDLVLWSASFPALTQIYPKTDYAWVWVGQPAQEEFAGLFGLFDETVVVDARRFQATSSLGYRLRTMWRLSGLSGEVVIHPVRSRTFLVGDALARALAAPVKIASRGDTSNSPRWQLRLGDRFYTRLLSWTGPGHELQFTAEFMAQLGGADGIVPNPALRAIAMREIAMQARGPDIAEPYFVVLPGAGWEGREWGVPRFVAAAGLIQQDNGWLCVWAGSADERRRLSPSLEPAQLRAVDLIGKTSTVELLRLIAGARMVLTNEASGAHLGAACGVPTVVIAGGGHVDRFVPWGSMTTVMNTMPCFGCNWDCIHPPRSHEPVPCIASIDVAQVPQRAGQR